jgi:hypothetical protein
MSANHSIGRTESKSKKNRSINLCTFTFADGRQCRTPRCSGHLHLCYFHAQKEAESLAARQVGQDISRFLSTKLLTACDLGAAMSRLFCAVARGEVKPKVASTLAYLAQTMLQSIPITQDEYIHSFDTDTWCSTVRSSFRHEDPDDADDRADTDHDPADPPTEDAADAPVPQPAVPPPASAPAPTSKPASSPAPQPPAQPAAVTHPFRGEASSSAPAPAPSTSFPPSSAPQPAPSPHTPLPRTGAEFAQRVLAGRNSSPSEIPTPPTPVEAGLQPGSSGSSSSPAPSSAPSSSDSATARTSSTQPAPSSLAPPPAPNNSHPAPTPPAPSPVPPGFGAPANWDVLIPPKPRRRFSRF